MKLFITFFLLLISCAVKSQTFVYSYTDPCTGLLKSMNVPSNGVTVTYFGQIQTFSPNDFQNGVFDQWANGVLSSYGNANPCGSILGVSTSVDVAQGSAINFISIINNISAVSDMQSAMGGGSLNTMSVIESSKSASSSKKDKKENKNNNNQSSNQTTVTNNSSQQSGNNGNQNSTSSSTPNSGSNSGSGNNSTSGNSNGGNGVSGNNSGGETGQNTQSNSQSGSNQSTSSNSGQVNQSSGEGGQTTNGQNSETGTQGGSVNSLGQTNQTLSQSTETNSQSSNQNSQNNQNPESNQNPANTSSENSNSQNQSGNESQGSEQTTTGTQTEGQNGENTTSNTTSSSAGSNGSNGGNGGSNGSNENPPNGSENSTESSEDKKTNVLGGTVKSSERATETNKPQIVLSSDFAGFNFRDKEVSFGGKGTAGWTSLSWDGRRSYGVLLDYTSIIKGPNVTGFWANMGKRRIDLISVTGTISFYGRGSQYGTLALGQMWSFPKVKNLKAIYMATGSFGNVYGQKFLGTAAIAGGMYDWKVSKRIDIKMMNLFIYAPYVSYYNDILLKSPYVIMPIIGTNIGITKKFKFNVNFGGAYAIKQNVMNFTLMFGTRFAI